MPSKEDGAPGRHGATPSLVEDGTGPPSVRSEGGPRYHVERKCRSDRVGSYGVFTGWLSA